jgi:polysaccharide export outer membrane protein
MTQSKFSRMMQGACLLAFIAVLAACKTTDPGLYALTEGEEEYERITNAVSDNVFARETRTQQKGYANKNEIAAFSSQTEDVYRVGPGDHFEFMVRGRPDISVTDVIVSPDGKVSLPRVGILKVEGQTLETIIEHISERLKRFYEDPEITLVMKVYNNNKVYVLGRVSNPGVVNFNGQGNLLEALSLAGGLPVDTTRSWLSRCMIVRGNDVIIWVNLRDLLDNGNMALNAKLSNGDVIYIPQSLDQVAYVMGEVESPGILQLRSQMTVLDAIMYRGGYTDDATLKSIFLVRAGGDQKGIVEEINLKNMIAQGDFRKNYVLEDGDIVFVPKNGMTKYNYYVQQLLPTLSVLDFSLDAAESLGALDGYTE